MSKLRRVMDKSGISPLIASLLLISFAVALGVVVMTFGRAQVELEAQCPINVGLKFSIEEKKPICYNTAEKSLMFTVENGINIDVESLVVNIISSQTEETFELSDARMSKAGTYLGRIPYDISANGQIMQVKVIPKIVLHDNIITCNYKAVSAEEVKAC